MILEEVKLLFAYNSWATNRVFEALEQMPAEKYRQEIKSSHGSIHGTLTHLVAGEKIWLSRLIGKPETTLLQPQEVGSLAALRNLWENVSRQMARFLSTLSVKKLNESFTIVTTEGKQFTHTYQQVLQHLVNHSTYHRGQITTLMRQLDAKPASTDLIVFYRQMGPKRAR